MAAIHILYPDVLSADDHAVERAISGDGVEFIIFNEREPDKISQEIWSSCQAMVTGISMPIDASVIARLDNCKIITRLGVGYDLIDIAAAGACGIVVCNVPDYGTNEVADHAIALLLSFTRGIPQYTEAYRADPDKGWDYKITPAMTRMTGKCFGVIGLGRIGTAAAMRAKGFGMQVRAYDPFVPYGQELALNIDRAYDLDELLEAADFITIHTPATKLTHHLINEDAISKMKRGVILVNTARGPICDLDAVYSGLKSGQIGAAGLDVFDPEPPNADHPLMLAWRARETWLEGRFVATPHAAFYSPTSSQILREKALQTCLDYLRSDALRNCVNSDCLEH
ncbi:MAG TPA: C-terminal binding protein [Alphaproteobacteria bacterium]|nr:C-terminal binding protein [Alphaproteobacteria bacterium]